MTAYLTRETAEALREALLIEDMEDSLDALDRLVTSLPVVDAVRSCSHPFDNEIEERASAVRHALRAAQAQADAPPPPDVIRRGHEGYDHLWCCIEHDMVDHNDGKTRHPCCSDALAAIRAALYPLKEE